MRQLVPVIFERISGQDAEERQLREEPSPQFAQLVASILPKDTDPFVVDAYLMFQDIVVCRLYCSAHSLVYPFLPGLVHSFFRDF